MLQSATSSQSNTPWKISLIIPEASCTLVIALIVVVQSALFPLSCLTLWCCVSPQHMVSFQGYFPQRPFIILSFARLCPPPRAMTSYFVDWLWSSFSLLIAQMPFTSLQSSCFPLAALKIHCQWCLASVSTPCVCACLTPARCFHRFHINLNPAIVQMRFLFCRRVDLFASLSSSPARLSSGKQHFCGSKEVWRAWLCRRPCLNRSLKGGGSRVFEPVPSLAIASDLIKK